MKVLITGANGYMGRHVVKEFLNRGCEVYVSDFSRKGMDERAKIIDTPIFCGDRHIFKELCEPDVLVHLAWRDGFVHDSDVHMRELSSHVTFLENMVDGGLPYLTVMGSMHEVGYWEGAVDEHTPCRPLSMYGVAKNALREAMMLYCRNKNVSLHWLRAYYIYGDDVRGSSVFSKLWQAVEDGREEFPFTAGNNRYDFIHIRELANQIASSSMQAEVNGIINVCTGTAVSLAEKVESYIRENHMDIRLKYGAFPDRPYDSPAIWGDTEKISRIMRSAADGKEK